MPIVLTRATKQDARYKALGGAEHCSACRFYMPQGTCGRIIGPVSPEGWCKYYSREAVQRWSNPGYAGLGGLFSTASLNLNFMTPGTLDPRITFTRASTATYTDAGGTIQTAATNAPRWDYDPVTHALRGLLIEEARTNLVLNSGDANNATWLKTTGGGASVPVTTANQTIAPDGTLTAARVVYPAVSAAGAYSNLSPTTLAATAQPYAFSVWLKGNVGGEQLYIFTTPDGVNYQRLAITLTTVWQRFALITSALSATNWFMIIGTDRRDATQTATPAQTIYAWGAQVEQGAFPTSYIPTAAAVVTRAQDNCTIPSANMSPWYASPGGSWFAEFISFNTQSALTPRIISQPAAANIHTLGASTTFHIQQYDGASAMFSGNTFLASTISKASSTWAVGNAKLCLNGGAVASSAALGGGFAALASTGTRFMANSAPGDGMSGYIRRVSYWPRVLSDAEMQQVTT